jgi:putative FmdB family regulatory protein
MPCFDFYCPACEKTHDHLIKTSQIDEPADWPPCDICGGPTERKLFGFQRFSDAGVNHTTLGVYFNYID